MKKHHVYGIGNALVDMEFEVTPAFLKKHGIEKGLMTLVDHERQRLLIDAVNGDGIRHRRSCGGSAANTVIAVAQCGGKAFYSCKVAADETGDFYCQDLSENQVHTNLHKKRESGVTGTCLVFVTPDADRTMNTFLGITSDFSEREIMEDELAASQYLYIEGYLVTSPSARAAAIRAKAFAESRGVKTALTFSDPAMVLHFKSGLLEILGEHGVDLLFCNDREAMEFTGCGDIESAAKVLRRHARALAITQGAKGAYIFDGEHEIYVLAPKVEAIDTNGAGDLFSGSFLYGITHGLSHAVAGKLATQAASLLVTQFGARLKREQMQQLLRELCP